MMGLGFEGIKKKSYLVVFGFSHIYLTVFEIIEVKYKCLQNLLFGNTNDVQSKANFLCFLCQNNRLPWMVQYGNMFYDSFLIVQ